MLDPYRMVFVNIIGSLLILFGTLFYRFIYPKKKINLFILLLLISFLPIISIFRVGTYESGDFNIHIYRIISFYNSLSEGIFMPSWAADLNATYGNPLFIFNYNLPYYIISLFHFIGFTFISSTKLYLALVMYFSGISMYLWINKLTKNNLAAFTAGIFYLFSPYHLIDVHFRATLGESTIFFILPLLFYAITSYYESKKYIWLIHISLISALLFLAHPLLAVISSGIAFLYSLFLYILNQNKFLFITTIISLVIGVLGSIYMWLPFLLFSNITFPNPDPNLYFYPFKYLFYSPWRFGLLFQGPNGELQQIIGYTQLFLVIISVIGLYKYKIESKIKYPYFFWLIIFLILVFLTSPFSAFIWKYFPLFWMLLPFGRLLLLISFCTSIIAAYFVIAFCKSKIKRNLLFLLIIFTIGYTILNWGHRTVLPNIDDNDLIRNVPYSTLNEGITAYFLNNKWADKENFWFDKIPSKHLEILEGVASVREISRTSIIHKYEIDAKTQLKIKENTLYFPGWKLTINGKENPVYPGKRGIINSNLPKGKYIIELKYEDVFAYKISKHITFAFFTTIIFLVLFSFTNFRRFYSKP